MKRMIFPALAMLVLMGCEGAKDTGHGVPPPVPAPNASVAIEKPASISSWTYKTNENAMGKKTKFATNNSTNTVDLSFPYHGDQHGTIQVRETEKRADVMFYVQKGQIVSTYDNEHVMIRFDNEKPLQINYIRPSDHSSDCIFLGQASLLISKFKKCKKFALEVTFYQNGNQIFEFDNVGLEWPIREVGTR